MSWKIFSKGQIPRPRRKKTGFTLVELLAVVGIMVLMLAFVGPAVTGIKGGRDIISNAYGIAGALEQARTYAMANNTYTWVGFFEEDGTAQWATTGVANSGVGRTIVSVIAARNGNRYTPYVTGTTFGTGNALTSGTALPLVQVSGLLRFENTHLAEANTETATNNPSRPAVPSSLQVGSDSYSNVANLSFKYPLLGTARYTFTKIIEFNPRGEASTTMDEMTPIFPSWIEVGLQPTRGNVVQDRFEGKKEAAVAIMVNGPTGKVNVIKQ